MAFDHKHLIDITEYSADDIMTILETAKTFKQVNERRIKKVPTLKGFTVVNMFNEPSTRTRSSFEIAEKRLSADSLNFGGSSTATVKGESLVDTVKTLCSYKIDCIVVRDRWAGVPRKIADVSGVSVIDAGAGGYYPSRDFCYGKLGTLTPGEVALSTGTLNIPGRMGCTKADIYTASPYTIAASLLNGKITDPRKVL